MNTLQRKARSYYVTAIFTFFVFIIVVIAIRPVSLEAVSKLTVGLTIPAYFTLKGLLLSRAIKDSYYDADTYTCVCTEEYGSYKKVTFLQKDKNELFIYITSKSADFLEDMEYVIYFKKNFYRTSNNVLAISLLDTETQKTTWDNAYFAKIR